MRLFDNAGREVFSVGYSVLPVGASTEAKQDISNTLLADIQSDTSNLGNINNSVDEIADNTEDASTETTLAKVNDRLEKIEKTIFESKEKTEFLLEAMLN